MQDVVREGTAQALKSYLPPEITVAGKTGTTDEQRDAWFAGFSGDRLAVVWVGYDDNRAARLSGSAAALPIWGDLMAALTPEPLALAPSRAHRDGVDRPAEAGCAAGRAARVRSSCPFMQGSAPRERAPLLGDRWTPRSTRSTRRRRDHQAC
jgi:penicillin-binding protein 1B